MSSKYDVHYNKSYKLKHTTVGCSILIIIYSIDNLFRFGKNQKKIARPSTLKC